MLGNGDQRFFGDSLNAGGDIGVALVFLHGGAFACAFWIGLHCEEVGLGGAWFAKQFHEAAVIAVFR